jgi:hypothetical protein
MKNIPPLWNTKIRDLNSSGLGVKCGRFWLVNIVAPIYCTSTFFFHSMKFCFWNT